MAKRGMFGGDDTPPEGEEFTGQDPGGDRPPEGQPRPATQDAGGTAGVPQINVVMPTPGVAPAPTPDMDKTVPGGRYLVAGQLVDANGNPIEE